MTKRAWLIVDKDGEPIKTNMSPRNVWSSEDKATKFLKVWADEHPEWRAVQITWRWK